ncbi:tetraacyldisaccharide 4'-kinase [Fontimonas sp. SYSU GA230001]|uniref:tetraacyldisaccharide 4'-kinase n=1 Tax=Fontimonas sp. SYSU GA230001 TaxID=3142450 RepID=UPI0032B3F5EE
MQAWLQARWYASAAPPAGLLPLSWLYGVLSARRRQRLTRDAARLPVPVIVVGNITVGGTGKTPFVIWLVERLREWGFTPGVVSRGYGGRAPGYPFRVVADGDPAHSGDEPLLIARRCGCPVMVDPDRRAAAAALVAGGAVDVIVADDGLQHYRLARDLEICVIDGPRGLGNGALLPAGPLREPPARLHEVDLIVVNGEGWNDAALRPLRMRLGGDRVWSLAGGTERTLGSFAGQAVHAVAGIGHPPRFFAALRAAGLLVIEHAFADHHRYRATDLAFADELPVLMTEKDAVKCLRFARSGWWALAVDAHLASLDAARVQESAARLRTHR